MPYTGLFSISTAKISSDNVIACDGVNALYGPFSISTNLSTSCCIRKEWVSMPYTGLFQFLPGWKENWGSCSDIVSMPYTGLFQFLRWHRTGWAWDNNVSMPYTGLFQFLRCNNCWLARKLHKCVNALYGPFSIST